MKTVLLTDSSYQPLAAICWTRAVTLLIKDKADLLESYDEVIRSPTITMQCPAVIRLRGYFAKKRRMAKFTKKSLCVRDQYECAYCGKKLEPKEVTFDHIQPKSKGGASDWHNLVLCCYEDNIAKGCRTPEEAGMKLLKKPYAPSYLLGIDAAWRYAKTPPQWAAWLVVGKK